QQAGRNHHGASPAVNSGVAPALRYDRGRGGGRTIVIEQDVREIRSAPDQESLRRAFAAALAALDIGTFNYGAGRLVPGEGPTVERYWTNMDPAWLERYVARGYQRLDRLVAPGHAPVTPFFFEEVLCVPPLLAEERETESLFPFRLGEVVPMPAPVGRSGMVSAASTRSPDDREQSRFACMASVSLVALSA